MNKNISRISSFELNNTNNHNKSENLLSLIRLLQQDTRSLEIEILSLKRSSLVNDRWDKRYSKRIAIWSNMLFGLWIFWHHFVKTIRKYDKNIIIKAVVSNKVNRETIFSSMVKEGIKKGLEKSFLYFFISFLLTRPLSWAKYIGVITSTCASLYLGLFTKFLPWANFFIVLADLLYIKTSLNFNFRDAYPSLSEYLENKKQQHLIHHVDININDQIYINNDSSLSNSDDMKSNETFNPIYL